MPGRAMRRPAGLSFLVPLVHSRRAPRRCDPDVGDWCSSTKVLASIPIPVGVVTIGTPVAQMTARLSAR